MKKNKLYTVNKRNRPAFIPYGENPNYYDLGSWLNNTFDKTTDKLSGVFGGDKLSPTAGSFIGAAGTAIGGAANKVLSGGLNSGAGNAVASIGGTVGGLISNVNPLLGGIVSAGTGIIGGGINALFGTKVDKEKLAAVNSDIARGRNFVSKAGTFEDIKGPEAFMTDTDVYSGGLFVGGNARRKNAALRKDLTDAALFAERSVDNNINNIWGNMVNDALYNYSAFGGPLDSYSGALGLMQNDKYIDAINNRSDAIMGKNNTLSNPQNYFGDGGGIHIKKANEGKFTAQANRAGMGVQEYASHVLANKEDYPASTVKRANFARNAAKWHAFGGELGTNGTDWTNGLLYVDAGGTHQQNPLGGVPVGFDQNGTPNLVEEGETIWNDYVFSNRIKVPKAMFHTLGLGGAMKKNRLTFADASKKLAKESEQRPNDPISMAGLESSLSKLAAVQEAERMKKQMRESVGLENMAAYGGPVNKFKDGGSLEWLKKNHPEIKHIEEVAKAMDRYIEQHPSRIRMKGDVVPYMNAYSLIANGAGNLLSPREMPAENSPVSNSRVTTGIIYGNEAAREQHFQDLIDLGLSKEAALDLSYPEPELKKSKSPNTQSANEVEYAEQMDRRNRFQERMYSAVDNNTRELPEPSSEYVSNYSNAHRAIQNARGISTPLLTLDPISAQQPVESEPQVQLQGIEPDALADVRTNAERNYLAGFTPNELTAFNNMTPAQRQAVLRQAPQESSVRNIPSNDTRYTGTSGVRGNGNTGVAGTGNVINLGTWRTNDNHWDKYTRPGLEAYLSRLEERYNAAETPEEKRAIASEAMNEFNNLQQSYYQNIAPGIGATTSARNNAVSEHQTMFNNMQGNYGFTNIADDINLPAGHSTGDVASQNWVDGYNGPRTWLRNFGSTEYGDNNYYQDLANRFSNMGLQYAPNQNWTYGNNTLYGLSMAGEEANNTDSSGNPQIMSPEEENKAKLDAAMQPSSNLPQPTGANGETNPGVDLSGRTSPIDEKRPLLPTWMRYAPVVGGALGVFGDMLGLTNKPDYTYADRLEAAANAAGYAPQVGYKPIGDYERYTPFDRLFYANQMQANARGTDRMLANTSSPSRAAGLLANAYNTNNALGNLYRQGDEYNLAQYQQVKDFNRRTNMFNSQMGLEADIANARYRQMAKNYQMEGLGRAAALRDAIDQRVGAARSANLTNFFNSLGNIGRENFIFNQINQDPSRSYTYQDHINGGWGYLPKFMQDAYQKDVESAAQRMMEEERKKNAEAQKATQPTSGAYGGKIKRNKK